LQHLAGDRLPGLERPERDQFLKVGHLEELPHKKV
jgi:hypothetical protein